MTDQRLLAGLDIGTTGCKLSVFNTSGEYLDSVYQDYPVNRTHSAHEVDTEAIWEAVQTVIAEAAKQYADIVGIGVTSFGETFVLLDQQEKPLLPAMLYTDPRGQDECQVLIDALGNDRLAGIAGVAAAPMYSLPKMMWVKKHRPELWQKVRHICLMEDFIIGKLTGCYQIDYSLAARTMAFDIEKLTWSETILQAAGIDASLLSRPVPTGTSAGCIKAEFAEKLGLNPRTLMVSVSHDQVAAAIGSGVLDESVTVDGAGTVECMTPVFRRYDAKRMAQGGYCIMPYLNGTYVTYAFSYTGGALIKWYIDQLAGYAAAKAKESGRSIYTLLEGEELGTPTGILVLPHFAGAGTPYMDGDSKGAVIGLTLSHTESDLYRACMEGVCYEMRLNQEWLEREGITIRALRATGGGAKSRAWLQMKADVLNVPITALKTSEAGAAGSAMLVGIAVGVFRDLQEASERMVQEKETFYPRYGAHERYEQVYRRYQQLYTTIKPLMK